MVPIVGLRHLPRLFRAALLGAALLLAVAMVLAPMALAQDIPLHVFENEQVTLHLYAAPCDNEAAKAAVRNTPMKDSADKLQKATSTWVVMIPGIGVARMPFTGCWAPFTWRGKEGYGVGFEDGEARFFPADEFKKTKGTTGT